MKGVILILRRRCGPFGPAPDRRPIHFRNGVGRLAGGSGRTATRYSCPTCHSGVFGRSEIMPGQINLYAGSLDDTSQFKPQIAIFTRSRPAWDTSSQELTCFETVPLT